MKPSDLKVVLSAMITARKPVLVTGAPGIGKTDILTQAANDAGADLVLMHPVVSDPTDFKGLPGIVKGMAEFLPYGDLRKLLEATCPTVCFLDDVGQAPMSVQAALMQLLLAREINGKRISNLVTFIAATNRRKDKAGVTGLLEPVKSRFTGGIIELTVDVDDWIKWALDDGQPIELIAFNKFRPKLMAEFVPTQDLVNSPSPRTVAALGDAMKLGLPRRLEMEVYSGIVGVGFATELLAFLDIYRSLPNIDQILLNPMAAPVPDKPDVLMAVCGALMRKATENNFGRILKYAERIPSQEFMVMLVVDATTRNPALTNTHDYIKWGSKYSHFLS